MRWGPCGKFSSLFWWEGGQMFWLWILRGNSWYIYCQAGCLFQNVYSRLDMLACCEQPLPLHRLVEIMATLCRHCASFHVVLAEIAKEALPKAFWQGDERDSTRRNYSQALVMVWSLEYVSENVYKVYRVFPERPYVRNAWSHVLLFFSWRCDAVFLNAASPREVTYQYCALNSTSNSPNCSSSIFSMGMGYPGFCLCKNLATNWSFSALLLSQMLKSWNTFWSVEMHLLHTLL